MFKQWLHCRLTMFLHHFWCSQVGNFKYNSLANCAFGNWVLMYFSVSVFVESYLFAAKECQLYIYYFTSWITEQLVYPFHHHLCSFLSISKHQKKNPKTPKIPPKLSSNVWMSSYQRFKWVKRTCASHNFKKQCEKTVPNQCWSS